MRLKKIISITLIVSLLTTLFSMIAFAEGEKPKVYLPDLTFYEADQGSELVIPICVEGEIDMQCFDITVTYDKSSLELIPDTDKTLINMTDEEYAFYDRNIDTAGTVVFAGVTVDETMKSANGTIGQLAFKVKQRIRRDTQTTLGLSVAELGLETDVADVEVKPDATITLSISQDPNQLPGDVDRNKVIDAADALRILQHAAKLMPLEDALLTVADVTGDKIIDAGDALQVLRHAARLIDLNK